MFVDKFVDNCGFEVLVLRCEGPDQDDTGDSGKERKRKYLSIDVFPFPFSGTDRTLLRPLFSLRPGFITFILNLFVEALFRMLFP